MMDSSQSRLRPGPGALTFALASLMVYSVVGSIVDAAWIDSSNIMFDLMLGGLIVAAGFSTMRSLPGWLGHLLATILSVVLVVARVGPLLDPGLQSWRDYATEIVLRLIFWLRAIAAGTPAEDGVLFLVVLGLAAWGLAYWTIMMLLRYGWIWTAIIVNAVTILVNLTFVVDKPVGMFFLFLLTALMLVVLETFRWRQRRWAAVGLEQQEFLSLRFLWSGVAVCTALVFITALLPTSITSARINRVWVEVKKPWNAIQERVDDTFTAIGVGSGGGSGSGSGVGPNSANFSRSGVTLGGARVARNEVVLEVKASRADYWRANAFDRYDPESGRDWTNTTPDLAMQTLGVDEMVDALTPWAANAQMTQLSDELAGRVPLTQTITLVQQRDDHMLVAATQPLAYSVPVMLQHTFFVSDDGKPVPNFIDTSIVLSAQTLPAGTTYTVISLISSADQASLREAGTAYPSWVDRYTQLPEIPTIARIAALTNEITAGADNPFDKAVKIEAYLRTFKYNDGISAPPADRNPVEYFLFESKEGYCDYFTSAMVLMLRTQGIPARWVQGYATGTYDRAKGAYIVRDTVAHSWPELYFPGFGWQRFEPTPASYVTRPSRPSVAPGATTRTPRPTRSRDQEDGIRNIRDIINDTQRNNPTPQRPLDLPPDQAEQPPTPVWPLLLALGLLGIAGLMVYQRLRRDVRGLSPGAAAYTRLSRLAAWAGWPQGPSMTPDEYGVHLSRRMPAHGPGIKRIVQAYVQERYGRADGAVDTKQLDHDLRDVRAPLLQRGLRGLARRGWRKRGRRR